MLVIPEAREKNSPILGSSAVTKKVWKEIWSIKTKLPPSTTLP